MTDISIRELKARTSAVMRDVQRNKSPFRVTCRGKAVGLIMPVEQALPGPDAKARAWAQFFTAAEDVGKRWKSPLTAAEVLADMRR
jgi:prevent-host-death family protein